MFGLRWRYKLPEVQPHGGGDMIAHQHAAEGGVLGKVEKRFESPGTIEVLTEIREAWRFKSRAEKDGITCRKILRDK